MPFDPSMLDPSLIPFEQIAFWIMTVFAVGGAIGVVSSKALFHSALFLLMVYIGAIAILILFAIMFSRTLMKKGEDPRNNQWWISLPIAVVIFLMLVGVVNAVDWPISGTAPTEDSVLQLGLAFLGSYLIPFMVVSILLSVTLIGAVFLARERTEAEEAQ